MGGPPPAAASDSETAVMQLWVRARTLEAGRLAEREATSPCLDAPRSDGEALRQFLRGRGSYDIGSVTAGVANNLAPFNDLQVALTTDLRDAPAVMDLQCPEEAPTLTNLSLMLRDEEERSLISETLTKPYVDRVMKGSRALR